MLSFSFSRSSVCHTSLACALALALVAPWPLAAKDEPASSFGEVVDVEVVNVDVYVTDRKGEPVPNLTAADFQLLEDGRPVKLSNFYAVSEGRVVHEGIPVLDPITVDPVTVDPIKADGAADAGPAAEPLETSSQPDGADLPPEQTLHMILFIDSLNISPQNRNRVILDLEPFLASGLSPEDRVMIVSHGAGLNMVQGFTDDRDLLVQKLRDLAGTSSLGSASATFERKAILDSISQANLPVASQSGDLQSDAVSIAISEARSIYSAIELYAQRHQDQTFKTLSILGSFVDSLAGVPGRKAIVYVSEGMSLRPGEVLFQAWEGKFSTLLVGNANSESNPRSDPYEFRELQRMLLGAATAGSQFNVGHAFRELGNRASANRVTFYGLRPESTLSVNSDVGTWDLGGIESANGGSTWSAGLASMESANRSGSMWELADATGGFAVTNAATFTVALKNLRRDFLSFYSLGYVPDRPRDGRKHRLEVKVSNRKYEVRYRRSHRNKSREELMQDRTLATLIYESTNNPLAIDVVLAPPRLDEAGHQRLPILVKVPVSKLALLPRGEVFEGRVSVHVGARDTSGRASRIQSVEVPIEIPSQVLPKLLEANQTLGHHFLLEMIPDQHMVAVGVRDEVANVESTTLFEQPDFPTEGTLAADVSRTE